MLDSIVEQVKARLFNPPVRIHVLPGGVMPSRQSEGAIGFDVGLRAILHATEKDPEQPHLRRLLFDFESVPSDDETAKWVHKEPVDPGINEGRSFELVYQLGP